MNSGLFLKDDLPTSYFSHSTYKSIQKSRLKGAEWRFTILTQYHKSPFFWQNELIWIGAYSLSLSRKAICDIRTQEYILVYKFT